MIWLSRSEAATWTETRGEARRGGGRGVRTCEGHWAGQQSRILQEINSHCEMKTLVWVHEWCEDYNLRGWTHFRPAAGLRLTESNSSTAHLFWRTEPELRGAAGPKRESSCDWNTARGKTGKHRIQQESGENTNLTSTESVLLGELNLLLKTGVWSRAVLCVLPEQDEWVGTGCGRRTAGPEQSAGGINDK